MTGILAEAGPDIGPALDDMASKMTSWGSTLIAVIGVIGLLWASMLLIRKLMASPGTDYTSWAQISMLLIVGGALVIGGITFASMLTRAAGETSGASDGGGESTSAPEETTAPSPEPTDEPADPISLPKIENADTILVVVAILVGLAITALIVWFLGRSARRARLEAKTEKARIARLDARWQDFIDRATDIRRKIYNAETDWDMLFSYPALTDVSVPATAALYRALRTVDDLDSTRPASTDADEEKDLSTLAYPKAVQELEAAWKKAFQNARRIGMSTVPEDERRKVEEIRRLLALAMDSGSAEAERQVAYDRAQKLIKKLRSIHVPQRALLELEEGNRLMIEAAAPSFEPEPVTQPAKKKQKRAHKLARF